LAAILSVGLQSVLADNVGTGGTITYTDSSGSNAVATPPYSGGYVVHTFTSSGAYSNSSAVSADVLVVAGGGGGGSFAGGGGAGGLVYTNAFSVSASSNYTVTVGGGGAGGIYNVTGRGGIGSNSVFGALVAYGGGGGGARDGTGSGQALPGGSGGGASPSDTILTYGGAATNGQGNAGGDGSSPAASGNWGGGGGGGAAAAGTNATGNSATASGGAGGDGASYSLVGSNVYYAGGGGGGTYSGATSGSAGSGGLGGGGAGSKPNSSTATDGVANTGGGGGGSAYLGTGGSGGSGIVIIRYPYDVGLLSVAVTSPTNDQQFLSGSSVTATVEVASGEAPYDVTFYTNTASAWSTNNSPTNLFTIDLGVLANGVYTNYATVTDNLSSNATSATNTFTVAADTTAPTPDPMGFAVAPASLDTNMIVMTASNATDVLSPPVLYYFVNTTNTDNSGWISSPVWTNTGLTEGTTYGYQVKARDSATPSSNETAYSAISEATPSPAIVTWNGVGDMIWTQPDANSFDTQYDDGKAAQFYDTGAGAVTIAAGGVTPGDVTVSNTVAYTFTGDIGGSGTFTKDGTADLTLRGTNTFTGGLVLDGATLDIEYNAALGATGSGITVNASSEIAYGRAGGATGNPQILDLGTRPISVATNLVLGYNDINMRLLVGGPITGAGGVQWGQDPSDTGNRQNAECFLQSTANTFTGPLTLGKGTDSSEFTSLFEFNSLADSTNPITINYSAFNGYFTCRYGSGATNDLVINQRPLELAVDNYRLINNNSTYHMYLNGPVRMSNTGGATLRFGSSAGPITVGGAVTNEGAKVIAVYKEASGTAYLAGTNDYSGNTTIASGTLGIKGSDAASPNTKFYMQRSTSLSLMMDDAGTVNLGNEVELNAIDTSSSITTFYTITVGNNGGATTGSTIALGLVDFHGGGGNYSSARIIKAEGNDGYGLQFGNVDMNVNGAHTGLNQSQGFVAFSAPITITGTVKQLDGNSGNTTANYLYLGGSNASNLISGLVKDPDDYPGNALAQPLIVRVNGGTYWGTDTSEWTFSNTNTYSGGTLINNGALYANTNSALGSGDVEVTGTSGDLVINSEDAMGATATLTLPNNTTETLTMNTNLSVGALTLGAAPQANGDYTTSSGTWITGPGTLTVGAPGTGPVYWDIDDTTAGSGPDDTPDGTWDGATARWNNSAGDGSSAAWVPSNTAVFAAGSDATGSYTVTVSGTRDISGLVVEEGNVTLSGGTGLRLVGNAVVSIAAGSTCTVANAISEDASPRTVSKGGTGTLVLSSANSYSGDTTVSEGTLQAAAADALSGGDVSVGSGTSLEVTAGGAVDGGTISIADGGTLQVSHASGVADAAGVTVGTLNSGTFTRDVDITLNDLTINDFETTFSGNALNFASGATIDSAVNSQGTTTFTCSISGNPDVRVRAVDQNRFTIFNPAAGETQALGDIVHIYNDGGGDKAQVILRGDAGDQHTIQSVSQENAYGYMRIESGNWTVNGDINQGLLEISGGTLIINGTFASPYSGTSSIKNTARLGGDCAIGSTPFATALPERDNFIVESGGILAPGDGGVGTITFNWGSSGTAQTIQLATGSYYEWDVGSGTNDLVRIVHEGLGTTRTLDIDDFVLKIQDATGSSYVDAGQQLPVITYTNVSTVAFGFGGTFDTSGLSAEWETNSLTLTDGGSGIIYLTGLSKPPPGGSMFMLR